MTFVEAVSKVTVQLYFRFTTDGRIFAAVGGRTSCVGGKSCPPPESPPARLCEFENSSKKSVSVNFDESFFVFVPAIRLWVEYG